MLFRPLRYWCCRSESSLSKKRPWSMTMILTDPCLAGTHLSPHGVWAYEAQGWTPPLFCGSTQQHFPPKKTGRSEGRMKTEWSGSLDHFLGPRADCFPFLFAAWICGIDSHWQWKTIRKWLQSCDVRQVPRSQQGAQLRGGECGIGRPHCHTGSKCVRLSDFFRICFSVFLRKLLKKRKTTWTLC